MANPLETELKQSPAKIRLGDDGELWGLPNPQQILDDKARQQEEAQERKNTLQHLETSMETTMETTIARLETLNAACNNGLFFELSEDNGQKALITRECYFHKIDGGHEGVFLIVSRHGFYAIRFPVVMHEDRPAYEEEFHDLRKLLDPDTDISFQYREIGFGKDEAPLFISGHSNKDLTDHRCYSSQVSGDARLLSKEDSSLIESCLEHSIAVATQPPDETGSQEEREHIASLEEQVALARQIEGIIPEPNHQIDEDGNLWQRIVRKRKKSKRKN